MEVEPRGDKVRLDPSLVKRAKLPGIKDLKAMIKKEMESKEPPTCKRRLVESAIGSIVATFVIWLIVILVTHIA